MTNEQVQSTSKKSPFEGRIRYSKTRGGVTGMAPFLQIEIMGHYLIGKELWPFTTPIGCTLLLPPISFTNISNI